MNRQADSTEVMVLRQEYDQLKHLVADLSPENAVLNKACLVCRASRTRG